MDFESICEKVSKGLKNGLERRGVTIKVRDWPVERILGESRIQLCDMNCFTKKSHNHLSVFLGYSASQEITIATKTSVHHSPPWKNLTV